MPRGSVIGTRAGRPRPRAHGASTTRGTQDPSYASFMFRLCLLKLPVRGALDGACLLIGRMPSLALFGVGLFRRHEATLLRARRASEAIFRTLKQVRWMETPHRTPPFHGHKVLRARSASEGYVDSGGATAHALAGASGSYLPDPCDHVDGRARRVFRAVVFSEKYRWMHSLALRAGIVRGRSRDPLNSRNIKIWALRLVTRQRRRVRNPGAKRSRMG